MKRWRSKDTRFEKKNLVGIHEIVPPRLAWGFGAHGQFEPGSHREHPAHAASRRQRSQVVKVDHIARAL